MQTTKSLPFECPGMGISQAAGWFDLNGKRVWVSFMADSIGHGKRRTWSVTASNYTEAEKPLHVQATVKDCYRYEAADAALTELAAFIR
jgi:hypothetical protein